MRRMAVAEGIVGGKSASTIAETTGVDRRTVFRDLQSNELKLLLDRMLDAKRERMTRLLDLSLDAIEEALHATRKVAVAQGKGVQVGSAGLELGEKSLAVRLTLGGHAPLTEADIDAAVQAVLAQLKAQVGARLRG